VTPFLDQPKYGLGQVQWAGLAGSEGHSRLVGGTRRGGGLGNEWTTDIEGERAAAKLKDAGG